MDTIVGICVGVLILGVMFGGIALSIYRNEHSKEYLKGLSDYPDSKLYDKVRSLRHDDNDIRNYCMGFESAASKESKEKDSVVKAMFVDSIIE
jgi:hypothetical protein